MIAALIIAAGVVAYVAVGFGVTLALHRHGWDESNAGPLAIDPTPSWVPGAAWPVAAGMFGVVAIAWLLIKASRSATFPFRVAFAAANRALDARAQRKRLPKARARELEP